MASYTSAVYLRVYIIFIFGHKNIYINMYKRRHSRTLQEQPTIVFFTANAVVSSVKVTVN